jgi:hypothetical protein
MRSGALTANELLALLGRAWPRLLIYPGGLAAFAIVWLIGRTNRRPTTDDRPAEDRGSRIEDRGSPSSILDPRSSINASRFFVGYPPGGSPLDISAVVLPWLGLALLPLPGAAGISRQTDLITILALLEWPLLLAIVAEVRDAPWPRRLAAALNSYPPLILATLVLTSTGGSFDMTALARPPDADAPLSASLLHWTGATAWLLALPPALAIGAFAAGLPDQRTLRTGLRLRAVGLLAIAALPWFPLVGANSAPGGPSASGPAWLWLPLPPLLIVALLWAYGRFTARHSARRWARAYLAFDAALLLVLLWAAYTALQARLA